MGLQSQYEQSGGFGPSGYREPTLAYDDQPLKRQRMSVDLARRTAYEHDQRHSQLPHAHKRDPDKNTLRPRLAVDRIMLKVHSLVPAPSNIPSATDVQIHLQTLRLICLHGPNILLINSQHLIRCINSIQETLLISTSRASITLPNRNRSHS